MRSFAPAVVLAVLFAAAPASAQPAVYICTPTSQVLAVDGTTGATSLLYTGAGVFHDCVLGPDGRLYIANDNNILRINPTNTSESSLVNSLPLSFTPRSLAFNVSTLYINTAASGVYRIEGNSATPDNGPLTFVPGAGNQNFVQAFPLATAGQGIVFDVKGNMTLASGTTLRQAPPPYNGTSQLLSSIQPVGLAVNTCREVVFADAGTKSVRRLVPGTSTHQLVSGLQFTGKDIPLYLEVASNNDMFILTAENAAGANAKVWLARFNFATTSGTCSATINATRQLLVELKTKLNGPGKVDGLASASGIGLALAATHHGLTHTFSASACSKDYDFGYHRMRLTFPSCSTSFAAVPSASIKVDALKSAISEVTFNSSVFTATPIEGLRYSSMGGFPVQYRLTLVGNPPPVLFPTPIHTVFFFETQEQLGTPGVARATVDDLGGEYGENVGDDYWATTTPDPAGARGDDISKRVVFNSGLAKNCTLTFEQPFESGLPLYKTGQTAKIAVLARDAQGQPCAGGVLRVSVVRTDGGAFEVVNVKSAGNAQTGNFMSVTGPGKYVFNLDLSGYALGEHTLTIWGNITAPVPKLFVIEQ